MEETTYKELIKEAEENNTKESLKKIKGYTIIAVPNDIKEVPIIIRNGKEIKQKVKVFYDWNTANDIKSSNAKLAIKYGDELHQLVTESKETIFYNNEEVCKREIKIEDLFKDE